MQRVKLLRPTVSGYCPFRIHMREPFERARKVVLCHEFAHVHDRETAPFPKRFTHPVRSLWEMRHGYMESRFERRAYSVEQSILEGTYGPVRLLDPSQLDGMLD